MTLDIFLSTSHSDTSYQVLKSIGLTVQKTFRIYFQAGDCGGQTGFPIRTNLAFFLVQQVTQILPTMFRVNWPFGSGEVKNRFIK